VASRLNIGVDRHSTWPDHGGGELYEAGKVYGATIVACGETSEVFQATEASFDAVALFVDDRVVRDGDLSTAA